jgi:hypothetical protein
MTRILGIISFLSALSCKIIILYFIITRNSISNRGFIIIILILLSSFSVMIYVYKTKFGKIDYNEDIKEITQENEIIKKKIEQKELLAQLSKYPDDK